MTSAERPCLNILVLHAMGPPATWRQAIVDLELAIPRRAPGHRILVHNAARPLPSFVKRLDVHGIVLGPTFLCARYAPALYARRREEYDFIARSPAVKIALPQDDYDCAAILDRWMVEWNVDRVQTVCPDHWDALYPRYRAHGGRITLGATGYITPELLARSHFPKPHAEREIDVFYRASCLPPNFGSIGHIKGAIAGRFARAFQDTVLRLDISVEARDVIHGSRWHDVLESSRFTLGTPSGSSLLDPEGEYRARVNRFLEDRPDASFAEAAEACFPGQDRRFVFTAISPRTFEAALLHTGQLLVEGTGGGFLEPDEHYIPLREDCGNRDDVLEALQDRSAVERMVRRCRDALLARPELRIETHVADLLQDIEHGAAESGLRSGDRAFTRAKEKYERVMRDVPYE
jgi:hypothetical protein